MFGGEEMALCRVQKNKKFHAREWRSTSMKLIENPTAQTSYCYVCADPITNALIYVDYQIRHIPNQKSQNFKHHR